MSQPFVKGGFIVWEDALNASELDAIEAYGDGLLHEEAKIAVDKPGRDAIRITRMAWMAPTPQTMPFYDRIAALVRHLNTHFYHFDVSGLENLQYTLYRDTEGGHYDWHIDYGGHNPRPRKISVSIQLSEESAYDGCELQLQAGSGTDVAPKKRGTLIAFPAFFLHRVTPITRGTRKSLVIWAQGAAFR